MPDQDSKLDQALDGLDPSKRATLKRLLGGGAFVAPVVASFAMQGLSIRPAEAAISGIRRGDGEDSGEQNQSF